MKPRRRTALADMLASLWSLRQLHLSRMRPRQGLLCQSCTHRSRDSTHARAYAQPLGGLVPLCLRAWSAPLAGGAAFSTLVPHKPTPALPRASTTDGERPHDTDCMCDCHTRSRRVAGETAHPSRLRGNLPLLTQAGRALPTVHLHTYLVRRSRSIIEPV